MTKIFDREFDVVILEVSPKKTKEWAALQTFDLKDIEITKRQGNITGVTLEFSNKDEVAKFGYQKNEIRFLIFEKPNFDLDESQIINACLFHLESWTYSGEKIMSVKNGLRTNKIKINYKESMNILDRMHSLNN